MPNLLDLANPIVTEQRTATAYFEDVFFQLFQVTNQSPVDVAIEAGIATVHLAEGSIFNITADNNFVIDVLDVSTPANRRNSIRIFNPAGAFNLTDITAPAGVTVYKTDGSSISTTGFENFALQLTVPNEETVDVLPFPLEPV